MCFVSINRSDQSFRKRLKTHAHLRSMDHDKAHKSIIDSRLPFQQQFQQPRFEARKKKLSKKLTDIAADCFVVSDVIRLSKPIESQPAHEILSLSDKQLVELFSVPFGTLANAAARTWRRLQNHPYSLQGRKTFRAPNQPELTARLQFRWLNNMWQLMRIYPDELLQAEQLSINAPYFDSSDYFAEDERLSAPQAKKKTRKKRKKDEYDELIAVLLGSLQTSLKTNGLQDQIGLLLGSVIDEGDSHAANVFDTLRLTIEDRHPKSRFGGHIVRALWSSENSEAHDTLLAVFHDEARIERRLRVLLGVKEASIDSFAELLSLTANKYSSESSLVNAAFQFLELPNDNSDDFGPELIATAAQRLSGNPPQYESDSEDWIDHYVTLWATATQNVDDVLEPLANLRKHDDPDVRKLAITFLDRLEHPWVDQLVEDMIFDEDSEVAAHAALVSAPPYPDNILKWQPKRFPPLIKRGRHERLIALIDIYAQQAANPSSDSESMSYEFRSGVVRQMHRFWDDDNSLTVFDKLGDLDFNVKQFFQSKEYRPPDMASLRILVDTLDLPRGVYPGGNLEPTSIIASVLRFEGSLPGELWIKILEQTQNADGREPHNGIHLQILEKLQLISSEDFEQVVKHFLTDSKAPRRESGLYLLLGSTAEAHQELTEQFVAELDKYVTKRAKREVALVKQVREKFQDQDESLAIRFGPSKTTPAKAPQDRSPKIFTKASHRYVIELHKFLLEHSDELKSLGKTTAKNELKDFRFPISVHSNPLAEPITELWQKWNKIRPKATRDSDGFEAIRAASFHWSSDNVWQTHFEQSLKKGADPKPLNELVLPPIQLLKDLDTLAPDVWNWKKTFGSATVLGKLPHEVWQAVLSIYHLTTTWDEFAFQYDVLESYWKCKYEIVLQPKGKFRYNSWLRRPACLNLLTRPKDLCKRHFELMQWRDSIDPPSENSGFDKDLRVCYGTEAAKLGDVTQRVLAISPSDSSSGPRFSYQAFVDMRVLFTGRNTEFVSFAQKLAEEIIASELNRTPNKPTELSPLAKGVGYVEGYSLFETLLIGTVKRGLEPNTKRRSSHSENIRQLLKAVYPAEGETPTAVAKSLKALLKTKTVSEKHLVQAAACAPQWCEAIELTLGQSGILDLLTWLGMHNEDVSTKKVALAHWLIDANKEHRLQVEMRGHKIDYFDWFEDSLHRAYPELRSRFERSLEDDDYEYFGTKTEPNIRDCTRQWVEPQWLAHVRDQFDEKTWKKYLGYITAACPIFKSEVTLSNAMLGKEKLPKLMTAATKKLGSVDLRSIAAAPLEDDDKRNSDILSRYQCLQACLKKAGSLFDDWERDLLRIQTRRAIRLLALNAGLADEEQLEWLVESAVAEEFRRHQEFVDGPLRVRLEIDPMGSPICIVTKGDKSLKNVPPTAKKKAPCKEQQTLFRTLKKFASKARANLENCMVESTEFTVEQIRQMRQHPVLTKMFSALLMTNGTAIGILDDTCQHLLPLKGRKTKLKETVKLRIAHPVDLANREGWVPWRDHLRDLGFQQPFPQIERGCVLPEHFEGSCYQPLSSLTGFRRDQALAILYKSGWEEDRYELSKYFSTSDIRAQLDIHPNLIGEGEAIDVQFNLISDLRAEMLDAGKVDAVAHSEVIRDLMLATSIAKEPLELEDETRECFTRLLKDADVANFHWQDELLILDGQIGTYEIDVNRQMIRMLPNQLVFYQGFQGLDEGDDFEQFIVALANDTELASSKDSWRILATARTAPGLKAK